MKVKKEKLGIFGTIQKIGKSLLFPIAVLPIAALLIRVGGAINGIKEIDGITHEWIRWIGWLIQQPGEIVFGKYGNMSALAALFAMGVGFGFSKDNRGEVALISLLGFVLLTLWAQNENSLPSLIYSDVLKTSDLQLEIGETNGTPILEDQSSLLYYVSGGKTKWALDFGVFGGIVSGLVVATVYNKFSDTELPEILGFFSGRRLIPILSTIFMFGVALLMAIIWPWINYALIEFSKALAKGATSRGGRASIMGVYGVINRLLIPFGLHHIPNTAFWFQLGEFDAGGYAENGEPFEQVFGDIHGFLKGNIHQGTENASTGILTAGIFQSGFFPVMMFGLPAAGFAIVKCADDKEKQKAAALFGGSALVSFTTGITEPIEFAFLFAAPKLFGLHAIFTGIYGFITGLFGIQLGFGFSAGAIDFMLSIPKSLDIANAHSGAAAIFANPFWIIPIGIGAATTYYFGFMFAIKKWNIETPGRGSNLIVIADDDSSDLAGTNDKFAVQAQKIMIAIGGNDNVEKIDWCATRLRLILKDPKKVDEASIKAAGALGQIPVGKKSYQIIIGGKVELVGNNLVAISKGEEVHVTKPASETKAKVATKNIAVDVMSPLSGKVIPTSKLEDAVFNQDTIGKGIAIIPSDNNVLAPFDGVVVATFSTNHAYGLRAENGAELLIHIGINTVELKEKIIISKVKQGQTVKQGDVIAVADFAKIKKLGKSIETPIIVTNEHKSNIKEMISNKTVKSGQKLFTIK